MAGKSYFSAACVGSVVLGLASAQPAAAEGPADKNSVSALTERALDRFNAPEYKNATVSFLLLDGKTGEVLAEREADRSIMPASIVKAITTAATLDHFAPDHRFKTTLEITARPDANGVVRGDLLIRGGGDPTLGSTRVDGTISSVTLLKNWTSSVLAAGVRVIDGDVVGDSSCFTADPVPDGFTWVDIGNGYGTGTNGLCFLENMYWVTFQPASTVGAPAPILRTEPSLPELLWVNEMRTGPKGSGDQGNIYGSTLTRQRWARGTIPQGGPEFSIKGSLPDPGGTLARLLAEQLRASGVIIRGNGRSSQTGCTSPTQVLAETLSPPLKDIIYKLNKQSQNLYAETMLLHMARAKGAGDRDAGLDAVREFLRKLNVPLDGVRLHDGSGLSRANSVTARAMAQLAFAMQKQPHFNVWYDSLPVLGTDGDTYRRAKDTPLAGKVHAKTGYIGGPPSRTLAGFLDGKSGSRYCFAFLVNDHSNSYSEVDKDTDGALLELYHGL